MTYYVKTPGEDEPKGPFDVKEIVRHIENAWVPENALIAVPGTHEWIPIKQVPDFAAAFAFLKKVGLAPPEAKSPKRERMLIFATYGPQGAEFFRSIPPFGAEFFTSIPPLGRTDFQEDSPV